jgi:hypothetical protein
MDSAGGEAERQQTQTPLEVRRLRIGRATIRLEVGGSTRRGTLDGGEAWVRRAARMTKRYYGRFPVDRLEIEVVLTGEDEVGFGQHWGGHRIRVFAGRRTPRRELERDWVMVHEILHTAFPQVADRHRWMQEGLSTYLESLVRAHAGVLDAEAVWSRWVENMPYGLTRSGERGLDHTPRWGRVYWGGALFWLRADLRIRQRTGGRRSLRDALRGVLAAGGSARAHWAPERIMAVGDRATGTRVLTELYRTMGQNPSDVDLQALWKRLGVVPRSDGIAFTEQAPLAPLRRRMTATRYQLEPAIPQTWSEGDP